MNFFQTLNDQFPDADLSIRIKCKNGMLTISVMPHSEGETNIQPLIVTGSAEELDKGFFGIVAAPLKETAAALVNLEQHRESVEAAKKEVEKETKPAPSKKPETKKPDPKKAGKKVPEKVVIPEVDLFAEGTEDEPQPAAEEKVAAEETTEDKDNENN